VVARNVSIRRQVTVICQVSMQVNPESDFFASPGCFGPGRGADISGKGKGAEALEGGIGAQEFPEQEDISIRPRGTGTEGFQESHPERRLRQPPGDGPGDKGMTGVIAGGACKQDGHTDAAPDAFDGCPAQRALKDKTILQQPPVIHNKVLRRTRHRG